MRFVFKCLGTTEDTLTYFKSARSQKWQIVNTMFKKFLSLDKYHFTHIYVNVKYTHEDRFSY